MISFRVNRPDETVLKLDYANTERTNITALALFQIPDRGELDESVVINLESKDSGDIREILCTPGSDGRYLRLQVEGCGSEAAAKIFAKSGSMLEDPSEMDEKFFLWFPEIMAGREDTLAGKWQLTGIRVFADHIDCSYGNGHYINLVTLTGLKERLVVQVVEPDGTARNALRIAFVERHSFHIGELRGYAVYHIKLDQATEPYWKSILVAKCDAMGLDKNYVLERFWMPRTAGILCVKMRMKTDADGYIAYDF